MGVFWIQRWLPWWGDSCHGDLIVVKLSGWSSLRHLIFFFFFFFCGKTFTLVVYCGVHGWLLLEKAFFTYIHCYFATVSGADSELSSTCTYV